MDSERSNCHSLVFQPAPRRIHSLMDLGEILTRRNPCLDNNPFELTEWHLPNQGAFSVPKGSCGKIQPQPGPLHLVAAREDLVSAPAPSPIIPVLDPVCESVQKGILCPVPKCVQRFSRSSRVLDHMLSAHSAEGRPSIRCPYQGCNLTCDSLAGFRTHQREKAHKGHILLFETGPRERAGKGIIVEESGAVFRYKCPFCAKVFRTRYRCSSHMDQCRSRDEGQFPCVESGCGKTFTCKESLNRHLKVCQQANHAEVHTKKHAKTHKNADLAEEQAKSADKAAETTFKSRVEELVDLIEES